MTFQPTDQNLQTAVDSWYNSRNNGISYSFGTTSVGSNNKIYATGLQVGDNGQASESTLNTLSGWVMDSSGNSMTSQNSDASNQSNPSNQQFNRTSAKVNSFDMNVTSNSTSYISFRYDLSSDVSDQIHVYIWKRNNNNLFDMVDETVLAGSNYNQNFTPPKYFRRYYSSPNLYQSWGYGTYQVSIEYKKNWTISQGTDNAMISEFRWGEYPHISVWNTNFITDMSNLFQNKTDFNDDISAWKTSNVTNMENMFSFTAFDHDISTQVMYGAILSWGVERVENMQSMFRDTPFNQNIGNWDVSQVTNMERMFNDNSAFNQDIGGWNTKEVTNMSFMFSSAYAFNNGGTASIGNWNVSKVTNMNSMFGWAYAFNQDISSKPNTWMHAQTYTAWDVSNVTDMGSMFWNATVFNNNGSESIGNWNTSNVTYMAGMFGSSAFDREIRYWNVSNVSAFSEMFSNNSNVPNPAFVARFGYPTGFNNGSPTAAFFSLFRPYSNEELKVAVNLWNSNTVTSWRQVDNYQPWNESPVGTWTSLNHGGGTTSWIQFTYNSSSEFTLSFDYIVSSEAGYDEFRFYAVTGGISTLELEKSGTKNDTFSHTFVSGNYDFRFQYFKDGSVSSGSDDVKVSNVQIQGLQVGIVTNNKHISNWDTSLITDMSNLFKDKTTFNDDIGNWDTSNVTNMSNMFDCQYTSNTSIFNQDIGTKQVTVNGNTYTAWDTKNVTNMYCMLNFAKAFNNNGSANIGKWNTSKVTNMSITFQATLVFNQDIGTKQVTVNGNTYTAWDTSNVESMFATFCDATAFNNNNSATIGKWNTSKVTGMTDMFANGYVFNQNIGTKSVTVNGNTYTAWDTSNVTEMDTMFSNQQSFNQDISMWDTSKVTNMSNMFSFAYAFNQRITLWDTSKVNNMSSMFYQAGAFNQHIRSWIVQSGTTLTNMFYNATAMHTTYGPTSSTTGFGDTPSITFFNSQFKPANKAELQTAVDQWITGTFTSSHISDWDTSLVTDMSSLFINKSTFNDDISKWNTSNVTDMANMFNGATVFNQDITTKKVSVNGVTYIAWDTLDVTDMTKMFENASTFSQDITYWNVSSVNTSMVDMFKNANAFQVIFGQESGYNNGSPLVSFFSGLNIFGTGVGSIFTNTTWVNAGKPSRVRIIDYETIGNVVWSNIYPPNTDSDIITHVIFGAGVTTINAAPFWVTANLKSVTIGPDMTTITRGFVGYAPKLTDIILDPANTIFHVQNNVLYKKNGTNNVHTMIQYPLGNLASDFTTPVGVVEIADSSAFSAHNLRTLTLNIGITTIGNNAFDSNRGLTNIYIPFTVTSIGIDAFGVSSGFENSSSPTRIELPPSNGLNIASPSNGVVSFYGINYANIEPPEVSYSKSNGITTATFHNYGDFSNGEITTGSIHLESTATNNNTGISATKIVISDGITTIGNNAFANAAGLTDITFSSSVTTIGVSAFEWNTSGTSSLTSINIPSTVTTIHETAFKGLALDTVSINKDTVMNAGNFGNQGPFINLTASSVTVEVRGTYTSGQLNNWVATNVNKFPTTSPTTTFSVETFTFIYSMPNVITGTNYGIYLGQDSSLGLGVVTIPSLVTDIADDSFKDSHITYVNIPASVTSIGISAFENCSALTTIDFDQGSTCDTIGENAFKNSGLTSFDFPSNFTHIMPGIFQDCTSLSSITIPQNMQTIGDNAFNGCSGMTSLVFSEVSTCSYIGANAFNGTSFSTVTLPASINTDINSNVIGTDAFKNSLITEIVLMGIYNITESSAWSTQHLVKVSNRNSGTITLSLEPLVYSYSSYIITSYVWQGFQQVAVHHYYKKITGSNYGTKLHGDRIIPSTIDGEYVTHITEDAFKDTELNSIVIPSIIDTIEQGAFDGSPLTLIELHESTSIGGIGSFLSIGNGNNSNNYKAFVKINGISSASNLNQWKSNNSGKFSLPINATGNIAFITTTNSIGTETSSDTNHYAFSVINYSTDPDEIQLGVGNNETGNGIVTINNNNCAPSQLFSGDMFKITQIGTYAFSDNSSIISFTIPNTVTTIQDSAFENCNNLSSIVIPNNVNNIGSNAFTGTQLTSITISSTTVISSNSFSNMVANNHVVVNLTGITVNELEAWKNINIGKFSVINPNYTIVFAIAGSNNMTLSEDSIEYIFTPLFAGSNEVELGDGTNLCITNTSGVTSITIPSILPGGYTVTKIANNAFTDLTDIISIVIPSTITLIGDNAFKNTSITAFDLNNTVSIGIDAFYGTPLTSITIPDTITYISENAFSNTSNLVTISVPKDMPSYDNIPFATAANTLVTVTIRYLDNPIELDTWKTTHSSIFTTGSSGTVAFLAGIGGFMTETIGTIIYVFSFTSSSTDTETNVMIGDGTTNVGNGTITPNAFPTTYTPPTSFTGGFNVTEIGSNAFQGITITDITIPDNILTIGSDAFNNIGDLYNNIPPKVIVQSSNTTAVDLSNYTFASSFTGANNGGGNMPVFFSTTTGIMIETGSNYVFTFVDENASPPQVRIGTGGGTAPSGNGLLTAPLSSDTLDIPRHIRGDLYNVTEIGQKAFMGYSIDELVLHQGLVEIRANAFKNIQDITKIIIPNTVNIAAYAFSQMTPLSEVVVTVDGTTGITDYNAWLATNGSGTAKFSVLSGNITFQEGVKFTYSVLSGTNVELTGSNNNSNLTGVRELPSSFTDSGTTYTVVSISNNAFIGSQITNLYLPATIISIGENAFKDVTTLTTITYTTTRNIQTIGSYAFQNTSITQFIVPVTLTAINTGAFSNNNSLLSLTFMNGRTSNITIGNEAFKSTGITSVIFPDTLTSIGSQAFADCPNLRQIELFHTTTMHNDSNVTVPSHMPHGPVAETTNLASFSRLSSYTLVIIRGLDSSSYSNSRIALDNWKTSYQYAFNLGNTSDGNLHIKFVTKTGHIIPYIHNGITYILSITGLASDKNVRIGNNSIIPGNGVAFPNMFNNLTISLPVSCPITIGGSTESYSVVRVGTYAFSQLTISEITIPSIITYINSFAFYNTPINNLIFEETFDTNYVSNSNLIEIGTNAFMNSFQGSSLLYVKIPSNVQTIKTNAFRNCTSIKQVSLSSTINIGNNAFKRIGSKPRILVTHTPDAYALYIWRSNNEYKITSYDGSEIMFIPYYEGIQSNVCFPAGTPVMTDQESVDIDKICIKKHTIWGHRIIAITKTITEDECLIKFEPDALEKGVPSIPTIMSCMHSVQFKGNMVPAYQLTSLDKVNKIPYTSGTILFNVLLDTYSKMMINNTLVETLHPNNGVAKFTRTLHECSDEGEQAEMKYKYNQRADELRIFKIMKHCL